MDYEKIVDALKTLKEVCEKSGGCQDCALGDPENYLLCAITANTPEFWNIKDIKEFKALKKMKEIKEMRADECLVEMLENIKAENEKLKKEIKELKEERNNLLGQMDTLTSGDDTSMVITEKTGNIFEISYFQDYEIVAAINDNKITIRDLGEALLDDNKILQKLEENLGVNKKYYLAHIDPFQYEYLIKFLGRTIAVPRNAFRQSFDCEYSIVHCYNIDNKSYFLDCEQAKKAVIEKARDEIRKALDIFTGVEEQ